MGYFYQFIRPRYACCDGLLMFHSHDTDVVVVDADGYWLAEGTSLRSMRLTRNCIRRCVSHGRGDAVKKGIASSLVRNVHAWGVATIVIFLFFEGHLLARI